MIFDRPLLAAFLALSASVHGHTIVRSIWVNGVDQGTGVGIRTPANNGPIGPGYNSSPVKNLTSIDLRCNLLGDSPAADTIVVAPGDTVSFEWGHESRLDIDDIIAGSHHGPGLVYISQDPPRDDSWVKLWEEGEYEPGKWFVTTKLVEDRGIHSIKIPADLAAGYYLLRPELITLHEGESMFPVNPIRGAQLYMACIQIRVAGGGGVQLPPGVGFPGAYEYSDPGINYNIYWTEPNAAPYSIPGPTVWTGADPPVANPTLGTKKGELAFIPWSKWIITTDSVVYEVKTTAGVETTASSVYTAVWPTAYVTPAPAPTAV